MHVHVPHNSVSHTCNTCSSVTSVDDGQDGNSKATVETSAPVSETSTDHTSPPPTASSSITSGMAGSSLAGASAGVHVATGGMFQEQAHPTPHPPHPPHSQGQVLGQPDATSGQLQPDQAHQTTQHFHHGDSQRLDIEPLCCTPCPLCCYSSIRVADASVGSAPVPQLPQVSSPATKYQVRFHS